MVVGKRMPLPSGLHRHLPAFLIGSKKNLPANGRHVDAFITKWRHLPAFRRPLCLPHKTKQSQNEYSFIHVMLRYYQASRWYLAINIVFRGESIRTLSTSWSPRTECSTTRWRRRALSRWTCEGTSLTRAARTSESARLASLSTRLSMRPGRTSSALCTCAARRLCLWVHRFCIVFKLARLKIYNNTNIKRNLTAISLQEAKSWTEIASGSPPLVPV